MTEGGTPAKTLHALNVKSGQIVTVMAVVSDRKVQIGDYSFERSDLERLLGTERQRANSNPEVDNIETKATIKESSRQA